LCPYGASRQSETSFDSLQKIVDGEAFGYIGSNIQIRGSLKMLLLKHQLFGVTEEAMLKIS